MFNINERIAYLENKAAEMKAFLNSAPEGNLVCRYSRHKNWRYFKSVHEKQEYILESNKDLAVKLALKKMFRKMIISAEKEAASLKKLSDAYGRYEKDMSEFFSDNPGCARLVRNEGMPVNSDITAKVRAWQQEEYIKNPYYPEYLIHDTIKGEKVRSKSEASIADMLYLAGIPYRYECQLMIKGEIFYPDFMIMNPFSGEILIWEHFGLMDMDRYLQRTVFKINNYAMAGYFPNKNFIITYEDKLHPFTAAQAREELERNFGIEITSRILNKFPI